MNNLRVFFAAAGLQFAESRREPSNLTVLLTTPVYAALFLSLARYSDSEIATLSAVFAPALLSLWFMAVGFGGDVIQNERYEGTLEALISSPVNLPVVVLGRLAPLTILGLACFLESHLMAVYVFRVRASVAHPWLLVVTIVLTLVSLVATASALAGLFVLSRKVLPFQNLMTYPFYILGGIMVPVAFYPPVVEALSRFVFLSWSSDLIKESMVAAPVHEWAARLLAIALLGAVTWVIGWWLLTLIVKRVRITGSVTA